MIRRESRQLAELAGSEGRSQAEIIREAITAYAPTQVRAKETLPSRAGFGRIDSDPRSISEVPDDELVDGFGR